MSSISFWALFCCMEIAMLRRVKFINKISDKVEHQYALVAYFTKRNQAIASKQSREALDRQLLKQLYGLSN